MEVSLLFDNPIRRRQDVRRNSHANLFGGFQVYDQLEFRGLLDRQIRRFGAFQNLIDIGSSAPVLILNV